jgi:hypothetical protein
MTVQISNADRVLQSQIDLETLKAIGLKRPVFWKRFGSVIIFSMILLTLTLLVIRLNLTPFRPSQMLQDLSTITVLIAFGLGYQQWRAARHEIAFDKYYDRLDLANIKFDAWRFEELKEDRNKLKDHLLSMFVFAELDNLEYILEKYKLGYVKQELAERALRTFRSRCEDNPFCERVLFFLGDQEGKQQVKGYEKTTRETARYIIRTIRKSRGSEEIINKAPLTV